MPSLAIRTFSYDDQRNELTVVFASGRAYIYSLVTPAVAAAFAAAPSKGAFHNANLRDRYPFRKADTDTETPHDDTPGASLRDALEASRDED
jgi:lysyl-tRNA synthetase class 2